MGHITAIKGQNVVVDLLEDYTDTGWSISGGKAHHEGCNAGLIELLNSNYTPNVPNKFTYKVSGRTSGGVNLIVGDNYGATTTTNTEVTEIFTPEVGDKIQFFSDGNLDLDFLRISPVGADVENNGRTFAFDEKNNRWVGEFSYKPEMMIRFGNRFFTGKNGELWRHNISSVMNNFYGQQFTSKIIFYCNLNPSEVKTFFSMRQKSDKVWSITDIDIPARYGKPNGQKSRIKSGNFKHLQGDWFASFLRDMNDPRMATELDALMNGALLQGGIMKITMENVSTTEFKLLSVDVICAPSEYTY